MQLIKTLKLIDFIDIVCNDNYELCGGVANYQTIMQEYFEMQSDMPEYKVYLQILTALGTSNSMYVALTALYRLFEVEEREEYKKLLQQLGYTYKSLLQLENAIKNTEVSLKVAEVNFQNYIKKQQDKIKESAYLDYIAQVSKYIGFHIDINTCSVYQFCGYSNNFQKAISKNGNR